MAGFAPPIFSAYMESTFYEKVLPTQGVYCVTTIDSDKNAVNNFAETLKEVKSLVEEFSGDRKNVFVALSSFNNFSRKADNAAYSRSFFVDLDVGNKGYATKDEAKLALQRFLEDTQLPPPIIVDSGNGIHAYWAFDSDIPMAKWKPYAKLFKKFCLERMMIDPAVTADAARIMRCPFTKNYKSDPPKDTFVISDESEQYDFDMFAEFLGEPEISIEDVLNSAEKGLDEETLKLKRQDNYATYFNDIVVKSVEGEGCEQIKNAILNSKSLSYYEWYSTLSIARACDDWEEAIHKLSEDYEGYDREKTVWKANETQGKPWSCETFNSHWPERCQGCMFKGKFINPLPLGRSLKEFPKQDESDPIEEREQDQHVIPKFPKFIEPFVRGQNGGIYYKPPPGRDEDGAPIHEPPIMICHFDLWPTKRMFSRTEGECLLVKYKMPHDEVRDVILPTGTFGSLDKVRERLGGIGLVLDNQKLWARVVDYMSKWTIYLQNYDRAEEMRSQLGWTEDHKSFVVGNIEIKDDGTEVATAESPYVRNISRWMRKQGTYETWQKAANMLNTPSLEIHAFVMLCGLGSTLMRLTSTSGASISLTGKSGAAKTGALFSAIGLWGNPKELCLAGDKKDGATDNGLIGRYLGLHSIPLGIDEVTNLKAEDVSRLIHKISQGKAKVRMQSSVNAERETEVSASLIGLFTSNEPLMQKLKNEKVAPEGESARLIEIDIQKPSIFVKDETIGEQIFDTLRVNFGHGGPEFIKYYYKKGDEYAMSLIDKWKKRVWKDFGNNSVYRFYHNLVAATFAAGELAVEAGILTLDLDRIFNKVMRELILLRDNTVRLNDIDYESIVSEYFMNNHSGLLIVDDTKIISDPKTALIGRIDVGSQRQYLAKTAFNKYLTSIRVSPDDFVKVMKGKGLLLDETSSDKKRRLETGWKSGLKLSSVWVYTLKTDLPEKFFDTDDQS